LFRPQIKSYAQSQVKTQLAKAQNGNGTNPNQGSNNGGSNGGSNGKSSNVTTAPTTPGGGNGQGSTTAPASSSVNGTGTAKGNGTTNIFNVPKGETLEITDVLVQNSAGNSGTISLERNGTVLMQWALANFRDLDYHWIVPTLFEGGSTVEMVVSGCPNACTPGLYYAGNLVKT
jgi:hypothetical protein